VNTTTETITAEDEAAIARALGEPGIVITAEALGELIDAIHGDDEEPAEEPEAPVERFVIDDEAKAAWALGKISAARAELVQRQQAAAAWIEEAAREVTRLEGRFLPELRAWGLLNLPKDKKTIVLMTGKLEYRNKAKRCALVDASAALTWAKANLPSAVIVKESVSTDALARYAKATGETPGGMEWEPAKENDSFKAK
jgi:hypothetical protein